MVDEPNKQDWAVLDLKPGARPAQVQRAYQRRRALYERDTLATYTLLSEEERSQMLERIELAYRRIMGRSPARTRPAVIPEQRRREVTAPRPRPEAQVTVPAEAGPEVTAPASKQPPPEPDERAEPEPLGAQPAHTTDRAEPETSESAQPKADEETAESVAAEPETEQDASEPEAEPSPPPTTPEPEPVPADDEPDPIRAPGAYLCFHRRRRRISLEAVADETKISTSQLQKLESESFSGLPAPVYVRGFIIQYARFLDLPDPERLAGLYLTHMRSRSSADQGSISKP